MNTLIKIFHRPKNFVYMLGISALIFDGYYLIMKKLPGVGDVPACLVGGALTPGNLVFSSLLSLLTGALLIGIIEMIKRRQLSLAELGPAGVGSILGFFSVFCALCTIPIISAFGLSFGLGFFTTYNIWFKIASLFLVSAGLWSINRKLRNCECSAKTTRV